MSAFIVTDEHITAMLSSVTSRHPGDGAYYRRSEQYNDENGCQTIQHFGGHTQYLGQILVDQNFRSVNCRYGEEYEAEKFVNKPNMRPRTPVEVIKLCDCYHYQSCETGDYYESEAWAIVNAIRERAIHNLPGYAEAEWTIYTEAQEKEA